MPSNADLGWLSLIAEDKPIYLAIGDAIQEGVRAGRLAPGARLPPQRDVAAAIGADLATVGRGYAEAQRRGLVTAHVGRGTFVAARLAEPADTALTRGLVDMSMNLPPLFDDAALAARMWRAFDRLEAGEGLSLLLRYQSASGAAADRAAASAWLQPRLPDVPADRIVVAGGAQAALAAVIQTLAQPGDTICAEALAYPGLRSAAAQFGVSVLGLPMDGEGVLPDAFAKACRDVGPKALCCTPTLHNPTTATMSARRRQDIAAVAGRYRVPIVEDDAYGRLLAGGPPPLAAYAPERTYYIAGLAKMLSPALRIAYLVAPDARGANRIAAALRSLTGMASPLTAALASEWIGQGIAEDVLGAIRSEARVRRKLAADILGQGFAAPADAFHLWLPLPRPWTGAAFQSELRAQEVAVVPSEVFATTSVIPEAVRVGLGAARTRADTRRALAAMAALLDLRPSPAAEYV